MRTTFLPILFVSGLLGTGTAAADAEPAVKITPAVAQVEVIHKGEKVTIARNQDPKNTVTPEFAKTSRECPPFCIQPGTLAPGVETVGEVEVLEYLQRMADGDESVIVIDSRTAKWVARGTIPGSVNIPWTELDLLQGADPMSVSDLLQERFGVKDPGTGFLDFSDAITAVFFCNGMWCGQSPNNIRNLIEIGYPAHKIKWYRGGMQDWEILGLSTVAEES